MKTLHQSGKLEPLLNVIEFGSEELNNYNTRLEEEIKQRRGLNYRTLSLKCVASKLIFNFDSAYF